MTSFSMKFTGLAQLTLFFRLLSKPIDFGDAWVGSAVEYSTFQEFGTRFLQERPHWRVAIPEIVAAAPSDLGFQAEILDAMVGRELAGTSLARVESGASAPLVIALRIERRVKQVMTAKGVVDTGNYRASIATGPTQPVAFANSAAKATDKSSIAS